MEVADPMINELSYEHRAGVLDGLADYGKEAVKFMRRRNVRMESLAAQDVVISEEEFNEKYAEARAQMERSQGPNTEFFSPIDASAPFKIGFATQSYASEVNVKISPRNTYETSRVSRHEAAHAMAWALGKKSDYSDENSDVAGEAKNAKENCSGIIIYSGLNNHEFWATMSESQPGGANIRYSTNQRKQHVDVFSPENAQARHPKTFAIQDELFRQGLSIDKMKRSLRGSNIAR